MKVLNIILGALLAVALVAIVAISRPSLDLKFNGLREDAPALAKIEVTPFSCSAPTDASGNVLEGYTLENRSTCLWKAPAVKDVQPELKAEQPAAAPTAAAQTSALTNTGSMPSALNSLEQNGWSVKQYEGITDQIKTWIPKTPATDWKEFPNVDSPSHKFLAKNGVEYGMAESAYCQQSQTCDVNTAAMHYRLISGDYNIPGIGQCKAEDGRGCAIVLVNVGNVTAMWRNSHIDYGFSVTGRYWNGDEMAQTLWALSSNTAYNMLFADKVNRGANCSVPSGCKSIMFRFAITSGNQMLSLGETVIR